MQKKSRRWFVVTGRLHASLSTGSDFYAPALTLDCNSQFTSRDPALSEHQLHQHEPGK